MLLTQVIDFSFWQARHMQRPEEVHWGGRAFILGCAPETRSEKGTHENWTLAHWLGAFLLGFAADVKGESIKG